MTRDGDDVWFARTRSARRPAAATRCAPTGPSTPARRLRPDRLLLDPYARGLTRAGDADGAPSSSTTRSTGAASSKPRTPLDHTVIYEAHVKGLTKLNPDVPEELRGTYAGLAHDAPIAVPAGSRRHGGRAAARARVHVASSASSSRASRTTGATTPSTSSPRTPPYAIGRGAGRRHRRRAARVQGHGASCCTRPASRSSSTSSTTTRPRRAPAARRRASAASTTRATTGRTPRRHYIDVTGCGNTVDFGQPAAAAPRARLAALLGERGADRRLPLRPRRHARTRTTNVDFDPSIRCSRRILDDPALHGVKMIAEPWDVGMGGWQIGNFPDGWTEWNDRYRDRMRDFWLRRHRRAPARRARPAAASAASRRRLAGSAHTFSQERGPLASRQLHHRARRLHARRPHRLQRRSTTSATARTTATAPTTTTRSTTASRAPTTNAVDPRRPPQGDAQPARHPAAVGRRARCSPRATSSAAPSAATTTPTATTAS